MAHFPRRDVAKDGVIVSDVAREVAQEGLSLVAVYITYQQTWQEAGENNPFPPYAGDILRDIRTKTESYRFRKESITRARDALPPPPPPEKQKSLIWKDMTEEQREEAIKVASCMYPRIGRTYLKTFEAPDDVVESCGTNSQNEVTG